MATAIVSHGAIGVDQLEKTHITGTEGQGGGIVERTVNTHGVGCRDNALDAHLLAQAYSNRVDASGEGRLERHRVAAEGSVGIGGSPTGHLLLLAVKDIHANLLVAAFVARGKSLVHRLGIYEELEGRTRLAHGCNLVILPMLEIDVAHPCLYSAGLGFHGNHTAVHEAHHIADRVEAGHLHLNLPIGIVKDLDLVGLVEIIVDGVSVFAELLDQGFVEGLTLGDTLDEAGDNLVVLILPWFLFTPMVVEVALDDTHLLVGCLFSILLHTRIYSSINLQATRVEVWRFVVIIIGIDTCADADKQTVAGCGNGIAEVSGLTIIVVFHLVIELDIKFAQFPIAASPQIAMLQHVAQHNITT